MSSLGQICQKYQIDPSLNISEVVKNLNELVRSNRNKLKYEMKMKSSAYTILECGESRVRSQVKQFMEEGSSIIERLMEELKEINDDLETLQLMSIDNVEERLSYFERQRLLEMKINEGAVKMLNECMDPKSRQQAQSFVDSSKLKIDFLEMKIDFLKRGNPTGRDILTCLRYYLGVEKALLNGTNNMLNTNESRQNGKILRDNLELHRRKIQLLEYAINRTRKSGISPMDGLPYEKSLNVTGMVKFCVKFVQNLLFLPEDDWNHQVKERKLSWVNRFKKTSLWKIIDIPLFSMVVKLDGTFKCKGTVGMFEDAVEWEDYFIVNKSRVLEIEIYKSSKELVGLAYLCLDEFLDSSGDVVEVLVHPSGVIYMNLQICDPVCDYPATNLRRNRAIMGRIKKKNKNKGGDAGGMTKKFVSVLSHGKSSKGTESKDEDDSVSTVSRGLNISDLSDVIEYIKNVQINSEFPLSSLEEAKEMPKTRGVEDYDLCCVLGRGHFGKVLLAWERATGLYCAIKGIKKHQVIEREELDGVVSELSVLRMIMNAKNPFLLNLYSVFQTKSHVCLVVEYMPGGDLMRQIHMRLFSNAQTVFYAACATLGLKFLHEKNVIYRDLKLDNLVMNLQGYIKIADFGLCKLGIGHGVRTTTFCGTPEFIAPEMLTERDYNNSVDWWELGVLVYEMLFAEPPFSGETDDDIFDKIVNGIVHFPRGSSRTNMDFVKRLLNKIPEFRFGSSKRDAAEIMEHKFFEKIDWEMMYSQTFPAPFSPSVKDITDVSCFDDEFTTEEAVLSPTPSSVELTAEDDKLFLGFV